LPAIFPVAAHFYGMKASLSFILTSALIMGAASFAFGSPRETEPSDRKAKHASSHHSHSGSRHRSSGSGTHHSENSGSKTNSNIPSN
jgi:hypothetical protein